MLAIIGFQRYKQALTAEKKIILTCSPEILAPHNST